MKICLTVILLCCIIKLRGSIWTRVLLISRKEFKQSERFAFYNTEDDKGGYRKPRINCSRIFIEQFIRMIKNDMMDLHDLSIEDN